MAIQTQTPEQLKDNIIKVVQECYSKSKQKKFHDLNFVFHSNNKDKHSDKTFKSKLQVFNSLDIYSKTFLSIHTKAKAALREFQQQKFEGDYSELLRLVLTLPDELNSKRFKSKGIRDKEERKIEIIDLTKLKPSNEQDKKAIELLMNIGSMEPSLILNPSPSEKDLKKENVRVRPKKEKVIHQSITSSPQVIHSNARIIKSTTMGKDIQKEKDFHKSIVNQLEDINL